MNILGPRVRLRQTRHDDLPFLQSLWNDGTVMRCKGYPQGMDVSDADMERWWATTPQSRLSDAGSSPTSLPHSMIELLDGTQIGEFSFVIDAQHRARIDLKLAAQFWGKGFAAEALCMALRELFATTTITKVQVEPSDENEAAKRLYQRCGFSPAPTENHPGRWECSRMAFAARHKEVAGSAK